MAVWFLQRMEGNVQSEVGPLRPSELLSLVRKGEIKPETKLRKDDSAWFPAGDVGGLFEAAQRRDIQYYCPACNRRIPEPPVTCPNCLRDLGRGEARQIQPEKMTNLPAIEQDSQAAAEQNSVQSWLKKKVAGRRSK
ncbi:DUF4339 domain-containing protein [Stieleria sp. TO1_6]|uniref:GYF domain-containing protein n=1 Tax=Stieleria tagensis TaxID=2956795 RepID=UPI00209B8BFE|nr:GYF domain-containing protein [Stieleria tagensis]MCO8123973.1 DUF4339 domain-containing protein [Stieleria tagensis]